LLVKPEEPHPAKATLCLPAPQARRGKITVEIVINYADMILIEGEFSHLRLRGVRWIGKSKPSVVY
jgi:hypothetical protein